MTARMELRFVTLIRAEFDASDNLKNAVNQFYEADQQPKDISVYTTAQRIVPARQHMLQTYERSTTRADELLAQPLACRALQLAGDPSPKIEVIEDGPIFMIFNAYPIEALRLIIEALEEIKSWEEAPLRTKIVLELGRAGLREPAELEVARQNMVDLLHDPSPENALTINNVRLSETYVKDYPVRSNLFWPC
jgi:hypothetical protein